MSSTKLVKDGKRSGYPPYSIRCEGQPVDELSSSSRKGIERVAKELTAKTGRVHYVVDRYGVKLER